MCKTQGNRMYNNISIFTTDSLYSYILLKDFIHNHHKNISAIYISKPLKRQKYHKFFFRKVINGLGIRYYLQRVIHDIKNKNSESTIINLANKYNIHTIDAPNINDTKIVNKVREDKTDIIISGYFDQIIKKDLIKIPSFGILNIHLSMLPEYRGVKPVFWVLKNNESKTGITIHIVEEGLDTGDIVIQKEVDILSSDSVDSLTKRMSIVGSEILQTAIENIQLNKLELKKQNLGSGSYYSQPTKKDLTHFKKQGKKFY